MRAWREICPSITMRSTFIAGFPGETEAEFEDLLDFLRRSAARPRRLLRLFAGRRRGRERAARSGAGAGQGRAARALHGSRRRRSAQQRLRAQGRHARSTCSSTRSTRRRGIARSTADAPEIDGVVRIADAADLVRRPFARVRVTSADAHDLHAAARRADAASVLRQLHAREIARELRDDLAERRVQRFRIRRLAIESRIGAWRRYSRVHTGVCSAPPVGVR